MHWLKRTHRLHKWPVGCRQLSCDVSLVPAGATGSAHTCLKCLGVQGCGAEHMALSRLARGARVIWFIVAQDVLRRAKAWSKACWDGAKAESEASSWHWVPARHTFVLAGKVLVLNTSVRLFDPTPKMPPLCPWKERAGVIARVRSARFPHAGQAIVGVGRLAVRTIMGMYSTPALKQACNSPRLLPNV